MAKKSQTEKDDNRLLKAMEVANTFKESLPLYAEFAKAVQKHVGALNATIATGRLVTECLKKIGDQTGGDLGAAINKVVDSENAVLDQNLALITKISEQLITAYIDKETGRIIIDKSDLANYEKNFKTRRGNSLKNVKKAEGKAAAANKPKAKAKKPAIAEAANQALDEACRQHDDLLVELLKEISVLQRKRGCLFLQQWANVMNAMIDSTQQASAAVTMTRDNIVPLLNTGDTIPDEIINICEGKEATMRSSSFISHLNAVSPLASLDSSSNQNGELEPTPYGIDIGTPEPPALAMNYAPPESASEMPSINDELASLEELAVQTPSPQQMPSLLSQDMANMVNNFDFGVPVPDSAEMAPLTLEASEIDELLGNL